MNKGNSNKKTTQQLIDEYDYLANAASSQDCTGLIPFAPTSSEEIEAYQDLYHFLPPGAASSRSK